ncbi:hypothetical protein BDB00DRAFT_445455 [Zychaea mexicana]|uniref:uncharacterized protein n=1 Tax=Zychaea mexicana TaxID=64656 RepID=UPI0022FEFD36|nr:uncharacterized protein BDB00DRAFT_445455 [Zychaea mexicana]KAI9498370.1 hypothetical protein BDB00DRAFT_445455 [Zychaea mexicana]
MLSVYPNMSLDINFSQGVPSTHGFSRGGSLPSNQFDPYLAASFAATAAATTTTPTTANSSGANSPALFDTQCSPFGFSVSVPSAGATHHAFMPSSPQPFLPQQQTHQQLQQPQQHASRTLASGSSPASSMQYSPVSFDQQLVAVCVGGPTPKLMAEDYTRSESGLPVDPCVYSRSSNSPLAGPVAAPLHHPPPPPQPTTLSPTIPYHHHHHGYHPYMYPGNVFSLNQQSDNGE